MLIDNQLVQITIGNNSRYYRDLGYDVKQGDKIMVPVEHLPSGSHARVKIKCDICGKIIDKEYRRYLDSHTYDLDVCQKCAIHKTGLAIQERYGVKFPLQNAEIFARSRQTNLLKYGYEYPQQSQQVKEKIALTNLDRYCAKSPFESNEIQEKIVLTNIQKYGFANPSQSPIIKDKIRQICLDRYGVECVSQVKEFREKAMVTLSNNGHVPTSSQQWELYNVIKQKFPNAELNYPFSTCSLDVFVDINGIKIDCEYDSWYFHNDQQRDIKRDKFLQSNGFKTLRIRSGHLLPTEQELFDAIDYLVNTEHRFKEIILSDWKEKEVEECQQQLQVVS